MRLESNVMSQVPINTQNYTRNREFGTQGIDNDNPQNLNAHTKDFQAQTQNSINTRDTDRAEKDISTDSVNELGQVAEEKSGKKTENLEEHKNRITYGLKVIELMSEEEYQAFLWATQDLSESEKILMAQSLYRFTAFYQGKDLSQRTQNQEEIDADKLNAHRAVGVESTMIDNFIQRYKNAYNKLLQPE